MVGSVGPDKRRQDQATGRGREQRMHRVPLLSRKPTLRYLQLGIRKGGQLYGPPGIKRERIIDVLYRRLVIL